MEQEVGQQHKCEDYPDCLNNRPCLYNLHDVNLKHSFLVIPCDVGQRVSSGRPLNK